MNRNIPIFGFVIGLFLPVLGFLIVFLVMGGDYGNIANFFRAMFNNRAVASLVITLSILINIIPFIYYTNRRLDLTARGILISTVLYAVLVVLIKYVW
jgi:hypothetical protein